VSRLAFAAASHLSTTLPSRLGPLLRVRQVRAVSALAAIVAITWAAMLAYGIRSGHTGRSLAYARWTATAGRVEGIDGYLSAMARAGADDLHKPMLFDVDGPLVTYPRERNILRIRALDKGQPRHVADTESLEFFTSDSFAMLVAAIRSRIAVGAGLIIPPYFEHFRDALPRHRIFLQEHHDGNLMLGAPQFAAFWTTRMEALLGFSYEGMPSKYSLLAFTRMRSAYLAIDGDHAAALKRRYPSFRYFLTEATHLLPYRAVIRTGGFVGYDLDSPTSLPH
jgi:hypothetical protein